MMRVLIRFILTFHKVHFNIPSLKKRTDYDVRIVAKTSQSSESKQDNEITEKEIKAANKGESEASLTVQRWRNGAFVIFF